jgi:hypothetical protein
LPRSPSRRRPRSSADGLSARLEQVFLHQAEQCERTGSPLYAELCRRLADEPAVREIVDDARWDRPLQLLGGLHYLALSEGIDPWSDPTPVLVERRDWLRRFIRTQTVQTNEVQRSWLLLPCFLEIARRTGVETFDLIELGPSAGLNLVWDRHRYEYEQGTWGADDAPLTLAGEERRPVPGDLLRFAPDVRQRRGIDLAPLDVSRPEDALLLKSFVWADQSARLERLDRAVETLRADPPQLERGDVVERLPELLAERLPGALTIVFQTAVRGYLSRAAWKELLGTLDEAGHTFPLALVSVSQPAAGEHRYWGLWLRLWPDGQKQLLAHSGFHGQWLEWLA